MSMNEPKCTTEMVERIKAERKLQNISQEKLAEKLLVHRNTYARWEKGEIKPPLEQIRAISKILKVPEEYLLGEIDKPEITLRNARLASMQKDNINIMQAFFASALGYELIGTEIDNNDFWENKCTIYNTRVQFRTSKGIQSITLHDYFILCKSVINIVSSCYDSTFENAIVEDTTNNSGSNDMTNITKQLSTIQTMIEDDYKIHVDPAIQLCPEMLFKN